MAVNGWIKQIILAFGLGVSLLLGTSVWAQPGLESRAANTGVVLPVANGDTVLTVSSGADYWYSETYESGETPSLLYDGEGNPRPDGRYRYEYRLLPSTAPGAMQQAAAQGIEGQSRRSSNAGARVLAAGAFAIQGGEVVFP